jgi:hypothetical protein
VLADSAEPKTVAADSAGADSAQEGSQ